METDTASTEQAAPTESTPPDAAEHVALDVQEPVPQRPSSQPSVSMRLIIGGVVGVFLLGSAASFMLLRPSSQGNVVQLKADGRSKSISASTKSVKSEAKSNPKIQPRKDLKEIFDPQEEEVKVETDFKAHLTRAKDLFARAKDLFAKYKLFFLGMGALIVLYIITVTLYDCTTLISNLLKAIYRKLGYK